MKKRKKYKPKIKRTETLYAARYVGNCGAKGGLAYMSKSIGERERKIRDAFKAWPLETSRKYFDSNFERLILHVEIEK